MSTDGITGIFDFLDCSTACVHCGMLYDPDAFSIACPCCNKALTSRVLRESTVDGARVDYAATEGINDDPFDTQADRSPEQATPRLTARRARARQTLVTTSGAGEAANAVLREFEMLLVADGYKVGPNRDGTAMKYCRYMKMLFDHDIFTCREDFFRPGARNRAHEFYRSFAKSKADEAGGATKYKKLYKNFANGYDKFVLLGTFLASAETTEHHGCGATHNLPEDLPIDDLLDELGPYLF
jgi:hypothetical protein